MRGLRGQSQLTDLYVADLPSGANVTLVESGILAFTLIGDLATDQAVEIVKDHPPGGTIELLASRAAVTPKTIFTYDDFLNGAVVSPDLRYTTWLNDPFLGVVFRNADLATCSMNDPQDSPVADISYLQGASLMFWKEVAAGRDNTALRDAYYAPPESCRRKARFAQNADQVTPVGDRGLILVDEEDDNETGRHAEVHRRRAGRRELDPAGAVRVHGRRRRARRARGREATAAGLHGDGGHRRDVSPSTSSGPCLFERLRLRRSGTRARATSRGTPGARAAAPRETPCARRVPPRGGSGRADRPGSRGAAGVAAPRRRRRR